MLDFYRKISKRLSQLSILYKFTFVITLVFIVCFIALTAIAQPVATNLAIEYAHRSMTQRLKSIRVDGFNGETINETYIRSLIQAGEFFSVQNSETGEEVFQINEIEELNSDSGGVNLTDQHVIRMETTIESNNGDQYLLIMYADIDATIEPYLNAYYRYIIPLISTNGLLLTLAGVFTVMYLTRRIQTFTDKMRLIRANGYQEELPNVYMEDEIGEMIQVFNEMIGHLQELHESQKQFVSDASHELKTPLAIIEGNAQLIEKWGKRDPQILDESIPALRRGVDRARMLIDDLLVLNRMTTLTEGETVPLHLDQLIEQYIKDLEVVHPDVAFQLELEAITYQIEQVDLSKLINIFVENGIKYSQSYPKITIKLLQTRDGFEIRVTDSGIGISPEHQQRIFERFYRVDSSRSRETGGNGIGLAVAKKIVLKYKGEIFVESQVGEGSTFVAQFKYQD